MSVYLCHQFPDLHEHDAVVLEATPGRVRLDRSALHPGGGGQVSDTGWLEHGGGVVAIAGVETVDDVVWHGVGEALDLAGSTAVVVRVDADRRARVAQLHTDSHILNAIVFERFLGTLV